MTCRRRRSLKADFTKPPPAYKLSQINERGLNDDIMASGIYARTMRKNLSGEGTINEDSGDQPSGMADRSSHDQGRSKGAAPLIAKQTSFVDRQLARRSRSRSKTRRIQRLRLVVALLVIVLVGTAMGWILAWTETQALESEALGLDSELRRTRQRLEAVSAKLAEREKEIRALVENRIPGLKEIAFNQLVDVNDSYVVNLTISESGTEEDRTLEYHTLLKNQTDRIVLPEVRIYLFDEFGLQVGSSSIEKRHATSRVDFAELSPGETRSYHAKLDIERGTLPKYYMLDIR